MKSQFKFGDLNIAKTEVDRHTCVKTKLLEMLNPTYFNAVHIRDEGAFRQVYSSLLC